MPSYDIDILYASRDLITMRTSIGRNLAIAYAEWINLEIDRNDWQNGTLFSPAQLVTINNLVDNHWMHRAGQKALSFMNLHMGTDFYIPPARNNWQPRNAKLLSDTDWETAVVEVYPNPANEIVTFEFHLSENSIPKGSLAIYDISNRLIEEFVISQSSQMISIDSRQWQSGLYMFIVKISGDVEHAGRFEIIH